MQLAPYVRNPVPISGTSLAGPSFPLQKREFPHHSELVARRLIGRIALARGDEGSGVAAGRLTPIQPSWRNEFRVAVAYSYYPAGVVDHAVVFATEHHEVVDIGFAAE